MTPYQVARISVVPWTMVVNGVFDACDWSLARHKARLVEENYLAAGGNVQALIEAKQLVALEDGLNEVQARLFSERGQ